AGGLRAVAQRGVEQMDPGGRHDLRRSLKRRTFGITIASMTSLMATESEPAGRILGVMACFSR
ncbi:MAG: hypothetical protein ACK4VM_08420, partial [Bosea sp. (in: a-proteobacteria)]